MLHYGFAEEDNEYDTFTLQLKMVLGEGGGAAVEVGTLFVRRRESAMGQFPGELWRALRNPVGFVERRGGDEEEEGGNEEEEGMTTVEVEDVEMLLSVLKSQRARMPEGTGVEEGDELHGDYRVEAIEVYLRGQIRLVEEAIETLEGLVEGMEGEEEEEEEEEEEVLVEPGLMDEDKNALASIAHLKRKFSAS